MGILKRSCSDNAREETHMNSLKQSLLIVTSTAVCTCGEWWMGGGKCREREGASRGDDKSKLTWKETMKEGLNQLKCNPRSGLR